MSFRIYFGNEMEGRAPPIMLTFTWLDFVATERFLRLDVERMFARDWVVFFQLKLALILPVLRVDRRVVRTVPTQLANKADKLSFGILLCHNLPYCIR